MQCEDLASHEYLAADAGGPVPCDDPIVLYPVLVGRIAVFNQTIAVFSGENCGNISFFWVCTKY